MGQRGMGALLHPREMGAWRWERRQGWDGQGARDGVPKEDVHELEKVDDRILGGQGLEEGGVVGVQCRHNV